MSTEQNPFFDDIFGSDEHVDHFTSHVLLYRGFDLTASGIDNPDVFPCLLCRPRHHDDEPSEGCPPMLTEEVLIWGNQIHFVCCGQCGTRGPWGKTESDALSRWNNAFNRLGVHMPRT